MPIRLAAEFSVETLQSRSECDIVFMVLKGGKKKKKKVPNKISLPAKLSFIIEGEIKNFPDKQK